MRVTGCRGLVWYGHVDTWGRQRKPGADRVWLVDVSKSYGLLCLCSYYKWDSAVSAFRPLFNNETMKLICYPGCSLSHWASEPLLRLMYENAIWVGNSFFLNMYESPIKCSGHCLIRGEIMLCGNSKSKPKPFIYSCLYLLSVAEGFTEPCKSIRTYWACLYFVIFQTCS